MTRNDMMNHAMGKINITDFDPDTLLWKYDDFDEITTDLLIQFALDTLVDVKLAQMEVADEQEGEEESGDQG